MPPFFVFPPPFVVPSATDVSVIDDRAILLLLRHRLRVQPSFQHRLDRAIAAHIQRQRTMAGRFYTLDAVTSGQTLDPQARTVSLLRMRKPFQDRGYCIAAVLPDIASRPFDQSARTPGKVFCVGFGSVRRIRGVPTTLITARMQCHTAFDSPEKQSGEITKILMAALQDRIASLAEKSEGKEETPYKKLLDAVKTIQRAVVEETQDEIGKVEEELRTSLQEIFPDHDVSFDAKPEQDVEKTINLFGNDPELKMGLKDGYMCSIDRQGSGTRRTLLWTALKIVSERKRAEKDASRPHVLLLDEPEICLHPNAIREACEVLYSLPSSGNWQVMVTTHSPCFIDVSRDNTTIIRVERGSEGEIVGTTIYRPERVQLDNDDRERLKLLNLCDPYLAEFFFGGKTVVVEGDTEYTAFQYIKDAFPGDFRDTHVIRARGKATIVSLMKILNHFGAPYAVLHDSDSKKAMRKGKEITNPAWSMNFNILEERKNSGRDVRLVASVPNFEGAYFDEELKGDKPYTALSKLGSTGAFRDRVEALLRSLVDPAKPLPDNAIAWEEADELENLDL